MSNPFDQLDIARDLVRRDENERMFDKIRKIEKNIASGPGGWYDPEAPDEDDGHHRAYHRGVLRGLAIAMDEIDGRIGFLRDRWG